MRVPAKQLLAAVPTPDSDLPLFPDSEGRACSKAAYVATFLRAADLLGVSTSTPDGSERVSGHTLRVTGVQGLARSGVDSWTIQLLGRWGSQAVLGDIRDAPLARTAMVARTVMTPRAPEQFASDY